jgi:hypothetical protein
LNNQQNNSVSEQPVEQNERRESVPPSSTRQKKQFVEPIVSVPIDVLEATSFFQTQTTLDAASTG